MDDEGYIKFHCIWKKAKPVPASKLKAINRWRTLLHQKHLIGVLKNGVGFGNISIREKSYFIVSGTATGKFSVLKPKHYTQVVDWNIRKNTVHCKGPIKASSESMSHAALYDCSKDINAVIHIHSLKHWKKFINKIPTTRKHATYGTPEMAQEIVRLYKKGRLKKTQVLVMGGHKPGLVAFGKDIDEAGKTLLKMLYG